MVYLVTAVFIIFDMLTGLVKAFKEKNYSSSIMREGLFHKCGSILCIVFGGLVDYGQNLLDIEQKIPIAIPICTYIIVTEIGSIIENLCAINPEMMTDKLKSYFNKLNKE